ncbi:MAG: cupin domain-containing protein [Candidatus Nitrosotenuis sp.]
MISIDLDSVKPIDGDEGSQLKQIFHPHNTMLGIRYSVIKCVLEPGKSSKQHILKSSEVYYVLSGDGILQIDGQELPVKANQAIYVPPHSKQLIQNTGKTSLEFLCIVDPAWKKEDELVIK